MTYDQQILQILTEVGQRGISVQSLAKHVYNLNCTLFFQPDVDEIRRWVWSFLQRSSRAKRPLVERTGRHGFYRLTKRGTTFVRQQMAAPTSEQEEEAPPQPPQQQYNSPGLFD